MGWRCRRSTGDWVPIPQRFGCTAVGGLLSNSINLISFLRSNCWPFQASFCFCSCSRCICIWAASWEICTKPFAVESRTKWAAEAVRSSLRGMVGCLGEWQLLVHTSGHRSSGRTFYIRLSNLRLWFKVKGAVRLFGFCSIMAHQSTETEADSSFVLSTPSFLYFMFLWFLPAPPLVSQFSTGRAADILCGIVALWGVKCARHSGISCWQERIRMPAGLRSFLLILAAFSSNMCPTNVAPVPPKEETTAHPHQQPGCLLLLHF